MFAHTFKKRKDVVWRFLVVSVLTIKNYYTLSTDQTIHTRILLKVCCNVFTSRIRIIEMFAHTFKKRKDVVWRFLVVSVLTIKNYYTLSTDQTIHTRILLKVCCNVFTSRIRKSAAIMFWVVSKLIDNRMLLFVTLFPDILASQNGMSDTCCNLTFIKHREDSDVTLCFWF